MPSWGWRTCWWMVVPPPTRLGVDTLGPLFGTSKLFVVELDPWGGVWCCPVHAPHTVSLMSSFSFLAIVSLIHRSVSNRSFWYKLPRIFISAPLCLCRDRRKIFGCNRVVPGVKFFVPSDVGLWFLITRAFQESVQYGFALLLPCQRRLGWDIKDEEVSWMRNGATNHSKHHKCKVTCANLSHAYMRD